MAILDNNDPDAKHRELQKEVVSSLIVFTVGTLAIVIVGVVNQHLVTLVALPFLIANCVCTIVALHKHSFYLMVPFIIASGISFLFAVCVMYYCYYALISARPKYSNCSRLGIGFDYYDIGTKPEVYGLCLFMSFHATVVTASILYAVGKCAHYYSKNGTVGGSQQTQTWTVQNCP